MSDEEVKPQESTEQVDKDNVNQAESKEETLTQESQSQEKNLSSEEGQEPSYAPNYKFKAYKEEKEFDEFIRPLIKDEDTEKKVRTLYEKAYGLDGLQPKYKQKSAEYEQLKQGINSLGNFVKEKDFERAFKALGISKEDVEQYVAKQIHYEQLPVEQRQQIDAQRQRDEQLQYLTTQNQQLMQQQQEILVKTRSQELDSVLTQPDVKEVADSFDSRMNQKGAFRNEVIRRGVLHYQMSGTDPSPKEVVDEVMLVLGTPTQANQMVTPSQKIINNPNVNPTLPNLRGGGSSPVRKKIRSIEDLNKLREAME